MNKIYNDINLSEILGIVSKLNNKEVKDRITLNGRIADKNGYITSWRIKIFYNDLELDVRRSFSKKNGTWKVITDSREQDAEGMKFTLILNSAKVKDLKLLNTTVTQKISDNPNSVFNISEEYGSYYFDGSIILMLIVKNKCLVNNTELEHLGIMFSNMFGTRIEFKARKYGDIF